MKTERSLGFVFISILLLSMFDLLKDGCQNHNKFLLTVQIGTHCIFIIKLDFKLVYFFSLNTVRSDQEAKIQALPIGTVLMDVTTSPIWMSFRFLG